MGLPTAVIGGPLWDQAGLQERSAAGHAGSLPGGALRNRASKDLPGFGLTLFIILLPLLLMGKTLAVMGLSKGSRPSWW